MATRFALAPMSGVIRVLTWLLMPLPVYLVALGSGAGSPVVLGAVAAFVLAIWVLVWCWYRPTRFEVSPTGLEVVWPVRRLSVPAHEIERVETTTTAELRQERGLLLRVGAGGLWGGFGMLWSSRGRHLDFYISRTDGLVLVHRRSRRPLLVTPERPEAFVESLRSVLS